MNAARLFLELRTEKRTTLYCVVPLDPDPDVATRAWRLWRPEGKHFYDVAIDRRGWATCTCADAIYRSRDCKHIKAMRAMGLLPKAG